ncbi:MAG TPA: hypothetical protein VHO25_15540, partial [Polyangiaceae bacterium]|nr:hypothetical protein [Polyangiaceae bacterium]
MASPVGTQYFKIMRTPAGCGEQKFPARPAGQTVPIKISRKSGDDCYLLDPMFAVDESVRYRSVLSMSAKITIPASNVDSFIHLAATSEDRASNGIRFGMNDNRPVHGNS